MIAQHHKSYKLLLKIHIASYYNSSAAATAVANIIRGAARLTHITAQYVAQVVMYNR
jgi:hypothetical protein